MNLTARNLVAALPVPIMAALGGALAVYSEYDDAPGGVLLGFLLIVCAVILSWRASGRRS
jgi:hypothetical protein